MQVVDIVLGVTSFFTIALGGLCVGMLLGLVTALITRFTKEVRQGVDISIYLLSTYLPPYLLRCGWWSPWPSSPWPTLPT